VTSLYPAYSEDCRVRELGHGGEVYQVSEVWGEFEVV
jgi:hypothetical protein